MHGERAERSDQHRAPPSARVGRPPGDARMEISERPRRSQAPRRAHRVAAADRPERDPALRAKYIKAAGDGGTRRQQDPDPNSPFAKLAKLKEQLEAGSKEPR
jgi:ATP-dependent RNA helicase SUPV3L1/SUV3